MSLCSQSDIARLEEQYGVCLPEIYKSFLLGSHPNVEKALVGTDMDMRYLPELRDWAQDMLEESGSSFRLASTDFVFLMHQGYQFMYFPCDDSDDPPVFYYMEGQPAPQKKFERFSAWLALCEEEG